MRPSMQKSTDSFVTEWHPVYFFIPVFDHPVEMPELETLLDALTHKLGRVQPMSDTPKMPRKAEDISGFALLDHPAFYEKEKQSYPSQLVLYGPDAFDASQWDELIISQFWDCPDKATFAAQCRYSIMGSNLMASNLPMQEQYQIIADFADVLLEVFPDCIGIYWPHSRRLVPREDFLAPHWNSEGLHFLDGGVNIRFFNIEGGNEMLFDTLGLTTLGLPDLQCHCKNLEPNDVVNFLRNLAVYLFQNGDVIEDGNTVEGIDGGKWHGQREDCMVGPGRMVLDICPGAFAGGGR